MGEDSKNKSGEAPQKESGVAKTYRILPLLVIFNAVFFLILGLIANGTNHPFLGGLFFSHDKGHIQETFHVVAGWCSLLLLTTGMIYVPMKYLIKRPEFKTKENLGLLKNALPIHKFLLLLSLAFATAHLVFSENFTSPLLLAFTAMCIVSMSGFLMSAQNIQIDKESRKEVQKVHRQQFLSVVFFGMFAFSHLTALDIRQTPPILTRASDEIHPYWGTCRSCHLFSSTVSWKQSNEWRLPPITRGVSVMPHRHFGVCMNCHEASGPRNNEETINQDSRFIHRRANRFGRSCSGCHTIRPLPSNFINPAGMFIKTLDQDSPLIHQWLGVCSNCHQVITNPKTFFSTFGKSTKLGDKIGTIPHIVKSWMDGTLPHDVGGKDPQIMPMRKRNN